MIIVLLVMLSFLFFLKDVIARFFIKKINHLSSFPKCFIFIKNKVFPYKLHVN